MPKDFCDILSYVNRYFTGSWSLRSQFSTVKSQETSRVDMKVEKNIFSLLIDLEKDIFGEVKVIMHLYYYVLFFLTIER